jgi:hypothetical protein
MLGASVKAQSISTLGPLPSRTTAFARKPGSVVACPCRGRDALRLVKSASDRNNPESPRGEGSYEPAAGKVIRTPREAILKRLAPSLFRQGDPHGRKDARRVSARHSQLHYRERAAPGG